MNRLTPLERMFVEEFCRFAGIAPQCIDEVRVLDRNRNPVGFITEVDRNTVPAELRWGGGVFSTPRVAVVGPTAATCGSLIFFDRQTGVLDAIEGFCDGSAWPVPEEPAFWSETERVVGNLGQH